jgi:hypothetical protein
MYVCKYASMSAYLYAWARVCMHGCMHVHMAMRHEKKGIAWGRTGNARQSNSSTRNMAALRRPLSSDWALKKGEKEDTDAKRG